MGTRADFYIRKNAELQWLGSVAMDGYDVDEATEGWATKDEHDRACWALKGVESEEDFRAALQVYFDTRDDVTVPDEHGWPWPWENSETTDRAYVFDGDRLRRYAWGKEIIGEDNEGPAPEGGWPDMSRLKNVVIGTKRDGVIVVGR